MNHRADQSGPPGSDFTNRVSRELSQEKGNDSQCVFFFFFFEESRWFSKKITVISEKKLCNRYIGT